MSLYSLISTFAIASGNSVLQTAARDWTGADLIAGFVSTYAASPAIDATDLFDNDGNSYVVPDNRAANGDGNVVLTPFYVLAPTVSSGATQVTLNRAAFGAIIVGAWTQGATPSYRSPATKNGGTGGFDTTIKAGSIGLADDLILPGVAWYANNGASIDLGFATPIESPYSAGAGLGLAVSWKQVSGAVDPEWTFPLGNVVAALTMAFTGIGSGAAPARIIFKNRDYA